MESPIDLISASELAAAIGVSVTPSGLWDAARIGLLKVWATERGKRTTIADLARYLASPA